ncbi:MAG: peptide chain release factor N(5)-glutamine methyltransferase [Oscillospiraceae bacterium]
MGELTAQALVRQTRERLFAGGIENAAAEARWLYEAATGRDCRLAQRSDETTTREAAQTLEALTLRRINGEPLQYLLGEWEFYGRRFAVGRGVLIPRQDTETLIDFARERFFGKTGAGFTVIDLCAGTGCIGLTLEKELPGAQVLLAELSPAALEYLAANARALSSDARILAGDVLDAEFVARLPEADLIVSNPPYLTDAELQTLQCEVAHEPVQALAGGADGMDFYRRITALWRSKLTPGGTLAFEAGAGQAEVISQILKDNGFVNIGTRADLCGIERVVFGETVQ